MKRIINRFLSMALVAALTFNFSMASSAAELEETATLTIDETAEPELNVEDNLDVNEAMVVEKKEAAIASFNEILSKKTVYAVVYLTDQCPIYELTTISCGDEICKTGLTPIETGLTPIENVESGCTLIVEGVQFLVDEDGRDRVVYQVSYFAGEEERTGYVTGEYIISADEDWIAWEQEYLLEDTLEINGGDLLDFAVEENNGASDDIAQFPSSYQAALKKLKANHPNWIFVKMDTKLDFEASVNAEMGDKSWIGSSKANKEKGWVGDATSQSGWAYATKSAVSYYMDPRNFLTEDYIFQFEQLTYNKSYHSVEGIQAFLNGTFMKGSLDDDSMTYAQAFMKIGSEQGISPTHLATRVYQEQGMGTSSLISGTYSGYEGYYNYFNVKASGKTEKEVIENGLSYAKEKGWNTRYKSLYGGAATIGNNYVKKGQDTSYLQKFNVNPNASNAVYTHQYMQNIQAPTSESVKTKAVYKETNSLNSPFVFKIPVFSNMPNQELEPETPEPETPEPETPTPEEPVEEEEETPEPEETIVTPPASFKEGFYIAPISDYTYTGDAIKPSLVVYAAKSETEYVRLVESVDYTLTYKNNKSAVYSADKLPTVIVTGKGNYQGKTEVTFNILPKSLSDKDIVCENLSLTYTGKDQSISPSVYYKGKKLTAGKDYYIMNGGSAAAIGTYTVTFKGMGCFKDSATASVSIGQGLPLSKAKITTQSVSYVQNVDEKGYVLPMLKVEYQGRTLVANTDYTISCKNNKAVGTATVKITAKSGSGFAGSKTATYKITATPIKNASIQIPNDLPFSLNQEELKTTPKASYLGKELKGIELESYNCLTDSQKKTYDYVVVYSNLTKAGTAKITYTGVNAFSGSISKSYKLCAIDIASAGKALEIKYKTETESDYKTVTSISQITDSFVKGGSKPQIQLFYKGQQLPERCYSVSYKNNTTMPNAETPTSKMPAITIAGKGGFTGKITGNFQITDGDFLNETKLTASDICYSTKAGNYKAGFAIYDISGKKLSPGADYEKEIVFATAAGRLLTAADTVTAGTEILAVVKGKGSYANTNERIFRYKIVQANLSDSAIKATTSTKYYNLGKEVKLSASDLQVSYKGGYLTLGKDYYIDETSYQNNTAVGKASVVIKALEGNSNFGGSRKIIFNIQKNKIKKEL